MQFNVHALDTQQQVIALSLEAASEADARGVAESRGLAVFSIEGKRALPAFRSVVLGFLMFYVVPRFAQVYEDMSHSLPFFSQLLLSFGSFVGKHGFFLFSAFILGAGSLAWALSRPYVRSAVMQRIWRLPVLGERMKTYQLARLYRTAGMLMRAGIPAVRALEMVQDLLASHMRAQLARASPLIEEG